MVLEGVLYFVLGFLASALLALMISPSIWNRAVVLTRRRIEASVPLTLNEIQADKDQLRAEFAMSTRRLEMSVEQLREKASHQVIEISRKRDELAKLAEESSERIKTIGELEARAADLRAQLQEREERLAVTSQRLEDTKARLEERALDLEKLRLRLNEAEAETDSRRIELVARQTHSDALSDKVGDARQREQALLVELAALKEQHARALADLERERGRNFDLGARIGRLDNQVVDREEHLQKRERDLSRLRESAGSEVAAAADASSQLLREQARNVELEARLAQTALQMEALLNDASNDNVEKAMASLNTERHELEKQLGEVAAERDALRRQLNGQLHENSSSWELERRENAILRERMNDLAAQVTVMTAALDGENSAINRVLAIPASKPGAKSARTPRKPDQDTGRSATLAERIRALQETARQNKAR